LRYERAEELLDVTKALWDSVEDGTLLLDKKSGLFADPPRDRAAYRECGHGLRDGRNARGNRR
jgi:alkanesulfonate monooxygenase SsuD/methylene tetrahydromethanopterin reductase-like flavin-dependent oxidoreductase (luciferase family)